MKKLLFFIFLFLVAYAVLETFQFFLRYGMFAAIAASIDVIWFFFAIYFLIMIFYDLFIKKYK